MVKKLETQILEFIKDETFDKVGIPQEYILRSFHQTQKLDSIEALLNLKKQNKITIDRYTIVRPVKEEEYNFKIKLVTFKKCMVWSINYKSASSQVKEIEKSLVLVGFEGVVIFDLLLSNGYSSNRFIVYYCDGFTLKDPTTYETIDSKFMKISSYFFRQNPDFVKASVLSETQKKELLNG